MTPREEKYIIGCMMLDEQARIRCSEQLDSSFFADKDLGTLFNYYYEFEQAGKTFDVTNLTVEFGDDPSMISKITQCHLAAMQNPYDYEPYIAQAVEVHKKSTFIAQIRKLLDSKDSSYPELVDAIRERADGECVYTCDDDIPDGSYETLDKELTEYLSACDNGFSTGLDTVDQILRGGLHKGRLHVLAASTGGGKSTWALQTCMQMISKGKTVVYFSAEMERKEILPRLFCILYGLPDVEIRKHKHEFLQFMDGIQQRLFIIGVSQISSKGIAARCKKIRAKTGGKLDAVIVDYLQLIVPQDNNTRYMSRNEIVSQITRSLKLLAMEEDIAVLALSQYNRMVDDGMPEMRNLKDSSSIEQDSDVVLLLAKTKDTSYSTLIVAKNRNGPANVTVKLIQIPELFIFEEAK